MKKLNLIYALALLSVFTSCKKEAKQQPPPGKPAVAATVSDSVSYTVDGKTYTAGGMGIGNSSSGGEDANRRVVFPDSTKMYAYGLVGNADSIMHFQESRILSTSASIDIFFVKKFIKQPRVTYWPPLKDVLTLFTVGKHPYAEDFGWQNSENGIAFDISASNKRYSSYNAYNGIYTIAMQPGFQKNSTFEIISFTPASVGYNLEAKFTAMVIDKATGEQKKLENGYLRLNIAPGYRDDGN